MQKEVEGNVFSSLAQMIKWWGDAPIHALPLLKTKTHCTQSATWMGKHLEHAFTNPLLKRMNVVTKLRPEDALKAYQTFVHGCGCLGTPTMRHALESYARPFFAVMDASSFVLLHHAMDMR